MLLIATNKLIAIFIPILATITITLVLIIQQNKKKDGDR